MTVLKPDWLEELVGWVQRPGIVGAGCKLLFPDSRVQHAGILLLAQGPSHVYYEAPSKDAGLVGSALTMRNYSAVTGACLAVRKSDYEAVGGFDPSFPIDKQRWADVLGMDPYYNINLSQTMPNSVTLRPLEIG